MTPDEDREFCLTSCHSAKSQDVVASFARETCGHRAREREQYQVSVAIPTLPLQVAPG
jgi:hypothetical protein